MLPYAWDGNAPRCPRHHERVVGAEQKNREKGRNSAVYVLHTICSCRAPNWDPCASLSQPDREHGMAQQDYSMTMRTAAAKPAKPAAANTLTLQEIPAPLSAAAMLSSPLHTV